MKRTYLVAAAAILASTLVVNAQDAQPGQRRGQGQGNPLFVALDANKDGVLDADEINNAPAALRKLDKNSDGKLTRDELRPAGARPGQGQGRPEGERPRRRQGQSSGSN